MYFVCRIFTSEKMYLLELMSYDIFLHILISIRKVNLFLMVKL